MAEPFILYQQDGRIVTVTLNRPATRNAIATHEDCQLLIDALERANADPEVSALILTGTGASFSAGGDLKSMQDRVGVATLDTPIATRDNYKRGVQRIPLALANLEIATIAAVNGHAVGLGLDIACLCDMRVAADTARFAASFLKIGIIPGDGGAWVLPRAVGYSRAAEMILTGDMVSAPDALAMGLVNDVVPAGELMDAARALARRVAVNPPRAVRLAKRLLREAQHSRLTDILELSAAFQAMVHETPDHREALDAFFEKRPPVFTGK